MEDITMAWHKAIYIMKYNENGETKEQKIYANDLKSAKAQSRAVAEKKNIGIMYGLTLEQSIYKY
jgi:hypothetical protein